MQVNSIIGNLVAVKIVRLEARIGDRCPRPTLATLLELCA